MQNYPRLCLLLLSFALAYVLYHIGAFDWLDHLNGYGYVSIFIGGLLFSFGFTTPFGIAIFVEMAPYTHPVPAALIAGTGALLSDFFIFDLLRFSLFHQEIARLRTSRLILKLRALVHHDQVPERLRTLFLWSVAGFIIASPLPDELGVSLMSGVTNIRPLHFAVVCFCFNTAGIMLIFLGARALA